LYFWQLPAPSHRPFVAHDCAPWSAHTPRGSTAPIAMGVQCPMAEDSAQLTQPPVQAPSQHTPSTHMFELHSALAAQAVPRLFKPHSPFTQAWPLSQSASDLQLSVHRPPVHRNGAQLRTPCGRHVPAPSHVPGVLRRVPVHVAGRQTVSAAYFSQPP
jgi:hypothetical protein